MDNRRPQSPRSRVLATGLGTAMGLVAAVGGLSACQAGSGAQTSQFYNPANGRSVNVPADPGYYDPYLAVRAMVIVEDDSGEAVLVGKIINKTDSDETLVAVTSGGSAATLQDGPVTLAPEETASFGVPDGQVASWSSLDTPVGRWTDLTLSFEKSGDVKLRVLVEPKRNDFAEVYFPAPSSASTPG